MRLKKFDSEAISTIEIVFHTFAFFPITIWSIGMALYKSPSIYCFGKRRGGGGLSFDVQPNIVKFLLAPVAFISTLIASGFCLMPFLITWLLNTGTIIWEVNVNLSKLGFFYKIYFRFFFQTSSHKLHLAGIVICMRK